MFKPRKPKKPVQRFEVEHHGYTMQIDNLKELKNYARCTKFLTGFTIDQYKVYEVKNETETNLSEWL